MTPATALQNRIQAIDRFAWPGLNAVLSEPLSPLARWFREAIKVQLNAETDCSASAFS